MNNSDFASMTEADVRNDPQLEQTVLMKLAQVRPDLRAAIRQHPNCYQGLADWIDRQPAVAQQAQQAQQTQQNQAPQQSQPQQSQAQQAQAGYAGVNAQQGDPQQFGQPNYGQFQYGQPQYARMQRQVSLPQSWSGWLPIVVAGLAVLGFISLLLPIMTAREGFAGRSVSFTFFQPELHAQGLAIILIILVIATAVLAAVSFFTAHWVLRYIYVVTGIVVGTLGVFVTIVLIVAAGVAGDTMGADVSPGVGAILGLIVFLLLLPVVILDLGLELKNKAFRGNAPVGFPGV